MAVASAIADHQAFLDRTTHLLTHDRPFVCLCALTFSIKNNLLRHQQKGCTFVPCSFNGVVAELTNTMLKKKCSEMEAC